MTDANAAINNMNAPILETEISQRSLIIPRLTVGHGETATLARNLRTTKVGKF
jgi:hypothetical protein